MSAEARLDDAQALYECGKHEGALLMLLVAIAATARKRYPRNKFGDKDAFTRYIQDEQANITGSVSNARIQNLFIGYKDETMRFPDLLYMILRNQLIHEATMPDDIRFIRGGNVLMRVGDTIEFNDVLLQGLANAVLLTSENREKLPSVRETPLSNPATVLARLYDGPLDFRRVLRWEPPQPEDIE